MVTLDFIMTTDRLFLFIWIAVALTTFAFILGLLLGKKKQEKPK